VIVAVSSSVDWQGTDVDVALIERHLSTLWGQLSSEATLGPPVRTSIFNLVVYTTDEDTAEQICANLDRLPGRQPSRVIVLIADRLSPRTAVDASISVRCHTPADGSRLCDERLVVTAYNRAAEHLDSVVIPLLLPDIPTYLWWPGQPPFGHRVFHRLLSVADQLVIDSGQFHTPGDGYLELSRLCAGKYGVNDFHWARLTQWRSVIAQFFAGANWLPYASGIVSMKIEFGSGDVTWPTSATLLLVGWLGCHLGWEPETPLDTVLNQDINMYVLQGERLIPIELQFRDFGQRGAGRLRLMEIVSQPRGYPPARFSVHRTEDLEHVQVNMEVHGGVEITRVVPLATRTDVETLADELDLAGHDRLYEVVAMTAARMAGREMWEPS
jgi:glucose-6-phosphate dehydrogenase assembly protein OpcA